MRKLLALSQPKTKQELPTDVFEHIMSYCSTTPGTPLNNYLLYYLVIGTIDKSLILQDSSLPTLQSKLTLIDSINHSIYLIKDKIALIRGIINTFEDNDFNELDTPKQLLFDILKGEPTHNKASLLEPKDKQLKPKDKKKLFLLCAEFGIVLNNEFAKNMNKSAAINALRLATQNGHAHVLEWLKDIYELTAEDATANNNHAFRWAAQNGHVTVLQWLKETYELTADDARAENNQAFRLAAKNGHVTVLKCLKETYDLTAEDARADDNYAL